MANPDYATLLALIAAETDPTIKAQLEAQCYVFTEELTTDDIELFEYCAFDYIENNPGYIAGAGDTGIYVLPDYVLDGYINIASEAGLYMEAGYALDGYVEIIAAESNSGFSSYAGVYYNNNGETT